MISIGVIRAATTGLGTAPLPEGHIPIAGQGGRALEAASIFLVLHAFASGGAAMTGVEAISNGVPAFKKPEWKNARSTLMIMGTCLAIMFIGISVLAAKLHTVPSDKADRHLPDRQGGVRQRAASVTRRSSSCRARTMLILVLAANTSFADFPRLASFAADDTFMPKQLTKRGHRLVFSNGIIALAVAATVLGGDLPGRRHPPHPALRHRRVHLVHPLAGRHGPAPPPPQGTGLEARAGHQRRRCRRHRHRHHRHRRHQVHPRCLVRDRAGADPRRAARSG